MHCCWLSYETNDLAVPAGRERAPTARPRSTRRARRRRPDHRRDHDTGHDLSRPPHACCRPSSVRAVVVFDVQAVCSGSSTRWRWRSTAANGGCPQRAAVREPDPRSLWTDRGRACCSATGRARSGRCRRSGPDPSAHLRHGNHREMLCVPGWMNELGHRLSVRAHGRSGGVQVRGGDYGGRQSACRQRRRCERRRLADPAHQANIRIIDATAKKLGVAGARRYRYRGGCLRQHVGRGIDVRSRSTKRCCVTGERPRVANCLLLLGVGGGFTWGSVYLTW